MKTRTLLLSLLLLLCALPVRAGELSPQARALIPANAVVQDGQAASAFRALTLTLPDTGETLSLLFNERTGMPLFLITETPATAFSGSAASRDAAEAIVHAAYPDARILSASDSEDGAKVLSLISDTLCGTITILGEGIHSRDLACGAYGQNGRLTMAGAFAALSLLRPEAECLALELDEDDGLLLYEGDARVAGVKYEYELDARTGRLLKWERD